MPRRRESLSLTGEREATEVQQAVIIGAGLGGLGTGIHLVRQGWDVTLLERNRQPGGRMNRIEEAGFRIDTGPTLLMMPEVLERLFADCGRRVEDYIPIRRLDPAYEVRFGDGSRLEMGRLQDMPERLAAFSPKDARRFPAMIADMRRKYSVGRYKFIERQFSKLNDLLHPTTLTGLAQSLPLESVWNYVSRYLSDPRLRQAMTFQTLYLGTSPFECPSIYGFLPFIEMEYGVWFPEGGMYSIAGGLRRLYLELGGKLECGVSVDRINVRGNVTDGVRGEDGRFWGADIVVSNADVQTTYTQMIDASVRRRNTDARVWKQESGASGYLFYLGVKNLPEGWRHHTVLLPEDYEGVMSDLFEKRSLPREPALYVCVPSLSDPTLAPDGHHVLYVLAPCPHLDAHIDWEVEGPRFRKRCLEALKKAGWDNLEEDIVLERQWTPHDFLRSYGCFRGSAFGLSCSFFQSAYFRPHNRSEDVRGLYFVGASTHPGGGVPIVLTSARLAAEAIVQDAERAARRGGNRVASHPGRTTQGAMSGAE